MTSRVPDHAAQPVAANITLGSLRRQFGDWEIVVRLDETIVSATRREGTGLHYICDHDLAGLAVKLEAAAAATP
jgi:hypothetical protein